MEIWMARSIRTYKPIFLKREDTAWPLGDVHIAAVLESTRIFSLKFTHVWWDVSAPEFRKFHDTSFEIQARSRPEITTSVTRTFPLRNDRYRQRCKVVNQVPWILLKQLELRTCPAVTMKFSFNFLIKERLWIICHAPAVPHWKSINNRLCRWS